MTAASQFFIWLLYLTLGLLLFARISPAHAKAQPIVFGEIPKRDSDRPRYRVNLPNVGGFQTTFHPPSEELPAGVKTMRMVTAKGQVMKCYLPPSPPRRKPGHLTEPSPSIDKSAQFDDIEDLLRGFEDRCFWRRDGWWTYEFCYGKHLIQKHVIPDHIQPAPGEVEVENVLGEFNWTADRERRKSDAPGVSLTDAPYTQEFTNGSECDLTKQPRRVVVKFMCSDDALNTVTAGLKGNSKHEELNILNQVREVESCVYEAEFLNSPICRHPTYAEKSANAVRQIHCSVDEGEGPFEGLDSSYYQRSSLSL